MATVYVAGPVPRDEWRKEKLPERAQAFLDAVERIYSMIKETARGSRFNLQLPEPEPFLDHAKPQEFYGEISARIAEADAVITVLSPFDLSAATESAIASMNGKNQLLVLHGLHSAPRIMAGMPSTKIVNAEDVNELRRALRALLEPPPRPRVAMRR